MVLCSLRSTCSIRSVSRLRNLYGHWVYGAGCCSSHHAVIFGRAKKFAFFSNLQTLRLAGFGAFVDCNVHRWAAGEWSVIATLMAATTWVLLPGCLLFCNIGSVAAQQIAHYCTRNLLSFYLKHFLAPCYVCHIGPGSWQIYWKVDIGFVWGSSSFKPTVVSLHY